MKIERIPPVCPPPEFSLTFPQDQGWVIVAALNYYAESHPDARDEDLWRGWAKYLDKLLRR